MFRRIVQFVAIVVVVASLISVCEWLSPGLELGSPVETALILGLFTIAVLEFRDFLFWFADRFIFHRRRSSIEALLKMQAGASTPEKRQ